MSSLLYVTISPVQSFIQQARKTQDSYMGSLLISHLTKVGIKVVKGYGGSVVFPNPNNTSLPNRFIAHLADDRQLEKIGQEVEKKIKQEFKSIGFYILNSLKLKTHALFLEAFKRQLEDYIQVFWVAHPVNTYIDSYQEIERLMGKIKTLRTFKQLKETGRKCSLTGEHNVLFYRPKTIDENRRSRFIPKEAIPMRGPRFEGRMKEGECLSAIAFIKRFATEHPSLIREAFPSTSAIALMDRLTSPVLKEVNCSYLFDIQNNNQKDLLKLSKEERGELYEIYDNLKTKGSLNPYYAIIIFDGDNMGRWFGGEYLNNKDQLEEFQACFTSLLGEYANWAKSEGLTEPMGKAVYAGGDDFFGYINLNYVFPVIKNLREKFHTMVNQELQVMFELNRQLTFSAGIAIGHYKDPLANVIQSARYAEETAKKVNAKTSNEQDKDAFSIYLLKRSGEQIITTFKWQSDSGVWVTDLFEKAVQYLQSHFSDTFIQVLQREFERFAEVWDKLFNSELRRLLVRSLPYENEELIDSFYRILIDLYDNSDCSTNIYNAPVLETLKRDSALQTDTRLNNFLALLNILLFVNRATKKGGEKDENQDTGSRHAVLP